ncbi:MAG: DUF4091 domain-containing protein [Bacteroidales bacterium]|nr:DUF4091 domain-containing protein [Bacteroidales bacterium]
MKKLFFLPFLLLAITTNAQQVDPYHKATGGFGYPVSSTPSATLWWAEGTYKIMQDMPSPSGKPAKVSIFSARNEWESFQLVIVPSKTLHKVKVSMSDFASKGGSLPSSAFTVRKVEYVLIKHPTDSYGKEGLWPDPLPSYRTPEDLDPGRNHPFWISVNVPKDASAGVYKGTITLSSDDGWKEEVPVSLEVWDFTLPDSPSMRSGFGLSRIGDIARYNNVTTDEQKSKLFDLYMKAFSEHKMSPYNPFELTPVHETVKGVPWKGGVFDAVGAHSGRYSYKVEDKSYTSTPEASMHERVSVTGGQPYTLTWWSRAAEDKQTFVVGVECFDGKGKLIPFDNRYEAFVCGKEWKDFSFSLGNLPKEAASVAIHLYPSKRSISGVDLGTVWFDDLALSCGKDGKNILEAGGFEMDLDKIDISLDFSDFLPAAKKYFGEYGFNSFRLGLKGLGSGTFYDRHPGVFEGFVQGTDEYNRLMQRYLKQMQDALEEAGILGKEYIYWFDEPGDNDYDFVRETNRMIKEYAPKINTFITEHLPGHDITDVTDISCSIWNTVDKGKVEKVRSKGNGYWTYLCTGPKSPWITLFIDHDAINMRMWSWGSYAQNLTGLLIWETVYWNSPEASPDGILQNPWEEAMSWSTSYGLIKGKRQPWGNGDGRLFYPENRHVGVDKTVYLNEAVPSYRIELLRDGIEDYEYFKILERLSEEKPRKAASAKRLLQIPSTIFTDGQHYSKDPQDILKYRRRLAAAIVNLSK